MEREVDRLFGRMGLRDSADAGTAMWLPAIDVMRRGDDIVVHAELPGMKPDDVDVSITDGMLTIRGERKEASESSDGGYIVKERRYGSFERSIVLPDGVDPAAITADFKNGVLEVTVPKAAEIEKPKTVKVSVGAAEQPAEQPAMSTSVMPGDGEAR